MDVTLKPIKIRDLVKDYVDNDEEGVRAYGGKLDVRPPYQREFVYKDKQRDSVIETIKKGFPLNIMYWVKKDDGTFEVLDGQQRTISICQYYKGDFTIDYIGFNNMTDDQKNQFLDYELMVYVCEGTDSEKLEWFKTINIAGEKLTDQELRNSVYAGPWLSDAKRYFSKTNGAAYNMASDYLSGSPIRQEFLEQALKWISNGQIEQYMAKHQHDTNANELWFYFTNVITWVETLFPSKYYRKEMKGQPWGELYNEYKDNHYDAETLEKEVKALMSDEDISNYKGVYRYIFDRKEKWLSIRDFKPSDRRFAYEKQDGKCSKCGKEFNIKAMDADHITPWVKGGKTTRENCQMLCRECNRRKSDF